MEGEGACFTWREKWEKIGYVLAEKKVTLSWLMNSNIVKAEKCDHLHLVYHFTVPLIFIKLFASWEGSFWVLLMDEGGGCFLSFSFLNATA